MAVPYTFGSATAAIPLSQLDSNFATTITLGNTAIQLGNTVTTLNNMTLANVTISSGSVTITDVTASGNVTISGGTANGVAYLNGSKVLTTGSALTFDGANLGIGTSTIGSDFKAVVYGGFLGIQNATTGTGNNNGLYIGNTGTLAQIYQAENDALTFSTNATERMRLDSSGNLGLGVTPSAWDSGYQVLQNTGGALWSGSSTTVRLTQNTYFATSFKYVGNTFASQYVQTSGQHQWFNAPSGTAGNAITFTQAMTLDANGRLGIGTTSPSTVLHTSSTTAGIFAQGTSTKTNNLLFTCSNSYNYGVVGTFSGDNTSGGDIYSLGYVASAGGSFNPVASWTSSGNLLVGTTSQENSAKTTITFTSANNGLALNETSNSNNTLFLFFRQSSTTIGSVTRVGTTSAVIYNTTSDYRLKDVIGAVSGSGERIDALKPINFKWTENNSQSRGFLAHEFQTVYPNSVTGKKDAVDVDGKPVYQAMQPSTPEVIADLVAEIQSLRQRLAAAGI